MHFQRILNKNKLLFSGIKAQKFNFVQKFKERSLLGNFNSFRAGLTHLIYPDLCLHCKRALHQNHPFLCYACLSRIELVKWREKETHHLLQQSLYDPFLSLSVSLYRFEKGSAVQTILHELKYNNNREIGLYFGRLIGQEARSKLAGLPIDALIPVPIHHRKRFDRGYNQSELLATGISTCIDVPVKSNLLTKTRNTKSQTKVSREERSENTAGSFSVSEEIKEYTSIALVDDVITTGATAGSICKSLRKKNKNLQITIFSLSIANRN